MADINVDVNVLNATDFQVSSPSNSINAIVNLPPLLSSTVTSPTQALVANVSIAGPTGPQGLAGIQGPSGATGPSGAIGLQGPTGVVNTGLLDLRYYSITNPSGFISGDLSLYATTINLASTGSTLNSRINSLSGTLTSNYATITNLASTGSILTNNIVSLSGLFTGFTGNLDATFATDTQVANTGSTLQTNINNLSGYINSSASNIVFTTGNQTISGNKTFIGATTLRGKDGDFSAEGITLVGGSGVGFGGGITLGGGLGGFGANARGIISVQGSIGINRGENINNFTDFYKSGDAGSSYLSITKDQIEIKNGATLLVSGVPVTPSLYATSANLASTGSTLATNIANTGSTLQTNINNLSNTYATITNLASTGSTLVTNLASTGSTLNSSINSLSGLFTGFTGTLDASYATDLQVTNTGITLNTRINNLSGYINSTSSNIVFTTGNQTISGTKTFVQDATFGDTGQGDFLVISGNNFTVYGSGNFTSGLFVNSSPVLTGSSTLYATTINLASTGSTLDNKINNLSGVSVLRFGDQTITGNKIFNSLRIEPSGRAFAIGTGLNINSESGIVRINTNVNSSLGAGFRYALTTGMDPNRPLDIEGRGRLVHGLLLDAGSANFTNASDHFHLFFSAGPSNPGSFNGRYSTDTNANYKSYQFSPTTRPNGNDNLRDLIHLTTLEAKGAGDQTFPTSNLTELYLTTTGTTVVTPPGTGLVELAYSVNSQATSQYLHSTGDTVYLRVFPGVAGIVANTYNGTVVTRATGLDPAYGSTNVYKVGIALGALGINNNFNSAQRGTSTQTDAWTLTRSTSSNAFTGITRIERNSSQYLDQFNVFYASPITGYTGESVVVDVFNRGAGTFIASGITLTQARYDGYVSKVLSPTGLEITLSVMNFGSLGGVGRPGAFHNPALTTGSAFISSEDLVTGMQIYRGASDSVHRNYWAHNVFVGFRNVDANELNVPAGVITRVAVGGLNRVESGSTSAIGFNNKAYAFNSHAYGAHQENYNRNSVRIGATNESYINIVSGKLGVNVVSPSATIDIGTGNIIAGGLIVSGDASFNNLIVNQTGTFYNNINVSGTGIFNAIDLNNIDALSLSGVDISITNGNIALTNRPTVNGTGVVLSGELDSTGILLSNRINSLSGSLNSSGSNLNSSIISLSGLFTGFTGSLDATFASDIQLANTGSTLDTKINNLSGVSVLTFGNQNIGGNKTFANDINVSGTGIFNAVDLNNIDALSLSGVDISITNGNIALTNRPTVNGTGVLLSGEVSAITLPSTIVYTTGNQTISGLKTFTNTGTFNSGIDLNNSNLINATPQIINLSANFNISGNYNSRMIMVNSATEVTGRIVSGNALGFNAGITQIGAGKIFITGSGIGITIGSYNNQYKTAGQFATVSVLHTGNNGYVMYGNTAL